MKVLEDSKCDDPPGKYTGPTYQQWQTPYPLIAESLIRVNSTQPSIREELPAAAYPKVSDLAGPNGQLFLCLSHRSLMRITNTYLLSPEQTQFQNVQQLSSNGNPQNFEDITNVLKNHNNSRRNTPSITTPPVPQTSWDLPLNGGLS
ncbi:hypothetical protein QAD02_021815 [Eretmocerus hayati]|uniref:Uncharacterized protein n=1 Tax=Eretmocerus hayati TaxID=131215 RepID=A0ACC2PUH0_9HYME|nr:hypothetical protein QAD02_021815 [Eretmocerus hayati]